MCELAPPNKQTQSDRTFASNGFLEVEAGKQMRKIRNLNMKNKRLSIGGGNFWHAIQRIAPDCRRN